MLSKRKFYYPSFNFLLVMNTWWLLMINPLRRPVSWTLYLSTSRHTAVISLVYVLSPLYSFSSFSSVFILRSVCFLFELLRIVVNFFFYIGLFSFLRLVSLNLLKCTTHKSCMHMDGKFLRNWFNYTSTSDKLELFCLILKCWMRTKEK